MPAQRHNLPGTIRVITILFTLVAILGCSFMQRIAPANSNQPVDSPPDSVDTSPREEGEDDSNVQIMDESYEPDAYEFPSLGSISFQLD